MQLQATFDVVLGVVLTGLATYVVSALLANKTDQKKQLRILYRVADAVIPEDRQGLVVRVENVEKIAAIVTEELENHEQVSRDQIRELKSSIKDLWSAVNATRREGTA